MQKEIYRKKNSKNIKERRKNKKLGKWTAKQKSIDCICLHVKPRVVAQGTGRPQAVGPVDRITKSESGWVGYTCIKWIAGHHDDQVSGAIAILWCKIMHLDHHHLSLFFFFPN